jgi:hypothetical protein
MLLGLAEVGRGILLPGWFRWLMVGRFAVGEWLGLALVALGVSIVLGIVGLRTPARWIAAALAGAGLVWPLTEASRSGEILVGLGNSTHGIHSTDAWGLLPLAVAAAVVVVELSPRRSIGTAVARVRRR